MSIPRAKRGFWRILVASQLYDVLAAFCALIGGVLASYRLFTDHGPTVGVAAVCALSGVWACAIVRAFVTYRSQQKQKSLHELHGCLRVLHAVLASPGDPQEPSRVGLRLTIHIPHESSQHLEQVLDYVGDPRGGRTAGRTFPMQSGVAGHAYRTGTTHQASRSGPDYEEYLDQLVDDWHYTDQDARALDPQTMSRIATPLRIAGTVEGVLYLDACDRDFFVEWRRRTVESAASGIALFVAERYGSPGRIPW